MDEDYKKYVLCEECPIRFFCIIKPKKVEKPDYGRVLSTKCPLIPILHEK